MKAAVVFLATTSLALPMMQCTPSPATNLAIETSQVPDKVAAKTIATRAYIRKMDGKVLATEGVLDITIVTLGYDVPGFARHGDQVWEARVMTVGGQLRGIMWVDPTSEAVEFVAGAWEASSPTARVPRYGQDHEEPLHMPAGTPAIRTPAGGRQ